MLTTLYLDTARLGRMTPRAQQANLDFARLAGEEGASVSFETFLRSGAGDWSAQEKARYPGLASFRGVKSLKEQLRQLAGGTPELPVLLANRSAQLMKLAARLLFERCRNVLVTDIGWPPYHDLLAAEARRAVRSITTVPIRDMVLEGKACKEEVLTALRNHFLRAECDGLFLTGVSHLGIRLPVEALVRSLEGVRKPRFVVVDGAQEFCHVPLALRNDYCDLYLAGCHKWLQACHPMGLAFYGCQRTRPIIDTALAKLLATHELDDPLLRFSAQLENDALDSCTETVNLACLFTCHGAAEDTLESRHPATSLPRRLAALKAAAQVALDSGWEPLVLPPTLSTGILLLRAAHGRASDAEACDLRRIFSNHGVALTAYDGGMVRLSMPPDGWQPGELGQLQVALREASGRRSVRTRLTEIHNQAALKPSLDFVL